MNTKNKINIKPLIDSSTGIFCHLLEVGSVKIILNCGIKDDFDYSIYDEIRETIDNADCILVTSFELSHFGASSLFPNQKIYCSIPTAVLGRVILSDYAHKQNIFSNKIILSEPNFIQIKFLQPFKIGAIEICAYNAGYCIGNSIFHLNTGNDSIVVGYNINQRKENFLDGMNLSLKLKPTLMITNSMYAQVPFYTLKTRDDSLIRLVEECTGKVIINCEYVRLPELLSILSKHSIFILAREGKRFIDRLKSMIEWAGSATDTFLLETDCTCGDLRDIKDQKIIFAMNGNECGYLGALIDQFNSSDNLLITISSSSVPINFSKLKIYNFKYSKPDVQETIKENEIPENQNLLEDNENLLHWSHYKRAIFIDKFNIKLLFPHIKRKRYNNDYGQVIKFDFTKKKENETKEEENKSIESQDVETAELIKVGIEPLIKTFNFDLSGVTDFKSFGTVIETINPEKLIIVQEHIENGQFLYGSFILNQSVSLYLLRSESLSLNASFRGTVVSMEEALKNIKFTRIGDLDTARCVLKNTNGVIEYIKDCEPEMISQMNILKIQKKLIESGYQVLSQETTLIINNSVKLIFKKNAVHLQGEESQLYLAIRQIFYTFAAIV